MRWPFGRTFFVRPRCYLAGLAISPGPLAHESARVDGPRAKRGIYVAEHKRSVLWLAPYVLPQCGHADFAGKSPSKTLSMLTAATLATRIASPAPGLRQDTHAARTVAGLTLRAAASLSTPPRRVRKKITARRTLAASSAESPEPRGVAFAGRALFQTSCFVRTDDVIRKVYGMT
jgi:hypothetical protein